MSYEQLQTEVMEKIREVASPLKVDDAYFFKIMTKGASREIILSSIETAKDYYIKNEKGKEKFLEKLGGVIYNAVNPPAEREFNKIMDELEKAAEERGIVWYRERAQVLLTSKLHLNGNTIYEASAKDVREQLGYTVRLMQDAVTWVQWKKSMMDTLVNRKKAEDLSEVDKLWSKIESLEKRLIALEKEAGINA